MLETELIYLNDYSLLSCEARVINITEENARTIVILDKTVFYPQGGGQPYDSGIIKSHTAQFDVEEVRLFDNFVRHIGVFQQDNFNINDKVSCLVNAERRDLHNRLHSAGHVLDMAVKELHLDWIPGKGYHFPNGPYVEYEGVLESMDKEKLKADLQTICNQIIKKALPTHLIYCSKSDVPKYCQHVPDYLPDDKPVRLIFFDNFAVPCGGTHVNNLSEIKGMIIRKIKAEKNKVKVSYDIENN